MVLGKLCRHGISLHLNESIEKSNRNFKNSKCTLYHEVFCMFLYLVTFITVCCIHLFQCSGIGATFCYLLSYLVGRRLVIKYIPEKVADWQTHVSTLCQENLGFLLENLHFTEGFNDNFLKFSIKTYIHYGYSLTLVLLNPDIPYLCKQCRSRSVGF